MSERERERERERECVYACVCVCVCVCVYAYKREKEREGEREREGLPRFEAVDARQIIFLNNTRRCFSRRITSCSSGFACIENTKYPPHSSCCSPLYGRSLACRYFSQHYEGTPLNIFALRIFPSPMTSTLRLPRCILPPLPRRKKLVTVT